MNLRTTCLWLSRTPFFPSYDESHETDNITTTIGIQVSYSNFNRITHIFIQK